MNESRQRKWVKLLDLGKLKLYPVQFANCDRIDKNDAVYIFDEVGCGKTISSGIIALDYLEKNPDEDVLVVTTNALAKYATGATGGQFKKDWLDKLPFEIMGLQNKINVINNHYSRFEDRQYGLIILDEAHLFLNKDSLRYKRLTENIQANKIVFLTATPIKESYQDLSTYIDIAKAILRKDNLNDSWTKSISTIGKEWPDTICSKFDTSLPVTRYFKDTIMSLNVKGFEKTHAKRLLPQLWEYEKLEGKNKVLLGNINEAYLKNPKNRFVVFTRFVDREAKALGNLLNSNGFECFGRSNNQAKTYHVVTGENAIELSRFSGNSNLPTVLILTYQIAEQGVNLPGFNHVINYHISSFPSALEQRFGRIDRMGGGSAFAEINMCYLIMHSSSGWDWDCNTINFYTAISTYLQSLLTYLPSKNAILSPEIIERYIAEKSLFDDYIKKLRMRCDDVKEIDFLIEYYRDIQIIEENNLKNDPSNHIETKGFSDNDKYELLQFCDDRGIVCDFRIDDMAIRENLASDIKDALTEMKRQFGLANKMDKNILDKIMSSIKDKIFYRKSDTYLENDISSMDAIEDCAKNISENTEYIKYNKDFNADVKIPILFDGYKEELNHFFEKRFVSTDLNSIFPISGYKDFLEKRFNFAPEHKELMLDNINNLVNVLPFFKMCAKYKEILHDLCWCESGYYTYRMRYYFNPFACAMGQLRRYDLGLSDEFVEKYFGGYKEGSYDTYFLKYFTLTKDNFNYVVASNWYKLAYHYTRKEEFASVVGRKDELYKNLEHKRVCLFRLNNMKKSPDVESLIEQYKKEIEYVKNHIDEKEKCDKSNSLFHDFIFTEYDNQRKYVKYNWRFLAAFYQGHQPYPHDYWTKGIYEELEPSGKSINRIDCWDSYLSL